MQKDFLGMQHSLLFHFFISLLDWHLYIVKRERERGGERERERESGNGSGSSGKLQNQRETKVFSLNSLNCTLPVGP